MPVQILDALVADGDSVGGIHAKSLTLRPPEQVIEVPKLSQERKSTAFLRFVVRRRQNIWWEVPTVLSFSSLQQQSAEQIIDIPAPRRRRGQEVFKVYAQNRVQQHRFLMRNAFLSGLWSRTLTFPFLEVACMFSPDPGGSSSSRSIA